jgi:hypothetical protein
MGKDVQESELVYLLFFLIFLPYFVNKMEVFPLTYRKEEIQN